MHDQIPGIPEQREGPYRIRYTWKIELGLWHSTDIEDPETQGLTDHVVLITTSEHDHILTSLFLPIRGNTGSHMSTDEAAVILGAWASVLVDRTDLAPELRPALQRIVELVNEEDVEPETTTRN